MMPLFICEPSNKPEAHPTAWWLEKALWAMSPAGQSSGWYVHFTRDVHIGSGQVSVGGEYVILCKGSDNVLMTGMHRSILVAEMHRFEGPEYAVLRAQKRYWDLVQRLGV